MYVIIEPLLSMCFFLLLAEFFYIKHECQPVPYRTKGPVKSLFVKSILTNSVHFWD